MLSNRQNKKVDEKILIDLIISVSHNNNMATLLIISKAAIEIIYLTLKF